MTYSEALEQQAALLRGVHNLLEDAGAANEIDQATYRALRYGETFWLGDSAETLVHTGSNQLPGEAELTRELVPSRQGFLLCSGVHGLVIDSDVGPAGLRGMLWDFGEIHDGDDPTRSIGQGVIIVPLLGRGPHANNFFIESGFPWAFGIPLATCIERNIRFSSSENPQPDGGGMVLRLFLALCLFLQQRILVAPSLRPERGTRRRLERADWPTEPVVRVIQLRRLEHRPTHGPAQTEHEWSCQWLVRGHWRQQFYPSKHANQPIWITPYIKGPENKPLKPPRATVFAVVR
jgi:hypothetical protein